MPWQALGSAILLLCGCAAAVDEDASPLAEIVGEWTADAVVDGLEDRLLVREDGTGEGALHRMTSLLARVDYEVEIDAVEPAFEATFDCDAFGCEAFEFTTRCELDRDTLVCDPAPDWYHAESLVFTRVAAD